jgi:hypothetical protein
MFVVRRSPLSTENGQGLKNLFCDIVIVHITQNEFPADNDPRVIISSVDGPVGGATSAVNPLS